MAGLAKKAGRRAGLLAKPGQARRPWGWPHVARANKIKGEVKGAKIQKGFEKDHCHCHADERVDLVDLDLRTSGIVYGKKSFLNLEINLFTISELDFKSTQVKDSIKKIVQKINNENFNNNSYFDFTLTKNGNIDKSEPQVYL